MTETIPAEHEQRAVERARESLAAVKALDFSVTADAYRLLGRLEVTIASLLQIIEGMPLVDRQGGQARGNGPARDERLSPDVSEMLAAVVEVLDVPMPTEWDDRNEHRMLLASRAAGLHGYLGAVVRSGTDAAYHADSIRKILADQPVTYEPHVRKDHPAETGADAPAEGGA